MIQASTQSENGLMEVTLTQIPSGSKVTLHINLTASDKDWDEFTTLIEYLGPTLGAMFKTSKEEGFTVTSSDEVNILVENVPEFEDESDE